MRPKLMRPRRGRDDSDHMISASLKPSESSRPHHLWPHLASLSGAQNVSQMRPKVMRLKRGEEEAEIAQIT